MTSASEHAATELDDFNRDALARFRDIAVAEVEGQTQRVAVAGLWEWDLGALVRAKAEADLYNVALNDSVDSAARQAMTKVQKALARGGSSDRHERTNADVEAHAAVTVLRALHAVGLSTDAVGALFLGRR